MKYFREAFSRLKKLLEEFDCEYVLHKSGEKEYSYLNKGDVCIEVINPHTDRNLLVDITTDEMSLFFANMHDHFYPSESLSRPLEFARGILMNELCSAASFAGEEHRWTMSAAVARSAMSENLPDRPENCFGISIMGKVYREKWEKEGAELRFLYWDNKYDRIITIDKTE